MFVENLKSKLKYPLQVHCCATFVDLVEKGMTLENFLIAQGELTYGNKNTHNQQTPNDKSRFWSYNKNVTNDGVIDTKVVNKTGPTLTLKAPNVNKNTPYVSNQAAIVVQHTQE